MNERGRAYSVLTMNTLAFTVCFAVWMMNGVLITFLVDNKVFLWDKVQMGWLIGVPVLTGSLVRLPVGVLTDKYGGRIVYVIVMLLSALGVFIVSYANSFWGFIGAGLFFGLAGTSFAVGIAYTSVWFPDRQQGTVLGIFGAGNAGAALTSMGAPFILRALTDNGAYIEGWRNLPRLYAGALVLMTIIFWLFTHQRTVEFGRDRSLKQRLEPLKNVQVWRFGLYYFLVFGGFVALAQWLIPYYVNVYTVSVATAGLMASIFTLPSGVIRALGGWMSDKVGARKVMYWVLSGCAICSLLLVVPRMDIYAPGQGVMALSSGTVTGLSDDGITVETRRYKLTGKPTEEMDENEARFWPVATFWHEPQVAPGDQVSKKQLLARGLTHIHFQANMWIFTAIVFVIGILMGIGKAAVYKHIPTYFPRDVGVVGGIVGVLGGLGGFFSPILFGYLLRGTGVWSTCWVFFFFLAMGCLVWMHAVIRKMLAERAPHLVHHVEDVASETQNAESEGVAE